VEEFTSRLFLEGKVNTEIQAGKDVRELKKEPQKYSDKSNDFKTGCTVKILSHIIFAI